MQRIRRPAVAGTFYPSAPDRLRTMIQGFLAAAQGRGGPPKAIIAPHAGYVYSGPIAGFAYARLAQARPRVERVVLLGPSHHALFRGLAVSGAEGFATPLGVVPLEPGGAEALLDLPFVHVDDAAHGPEHSLEVHLPFLQEVLGPFGLVPLLVGDASPAEVEEVLERLWGGDETAIVVSTDLSHYLGQGAARRMDLETSRAIEELRPDDIGHPSACGCLPVRGLLMAARRHGLAAEILDVRNSGDTAGEPDRVVGYGSYAFA